MRGASALQSVLAEVPDAKLRVFVVWEPVVATDVASPTTATLARLRDGRAAQYWDPDLRLSAELLRTAREHPELVGESAAEAIDEEMIVWDFVALFPPGATWDDAPPPPAFHGFPVVDVIEPLRARLGLGKAGDGPPSSFP